jgi:hypothetical protein
MSVVVVNKAPNEGDTMENQYKAITALLLTIRENTNKLMDAYEAFQLCAHELRDNYGALQRIDMTNLPEDVKRAAEATLQYLAEVDRVLTEHGIFNGTILSR